MAYSQSPYKLSNIGRLAAIGFVKLYQLVISPIKPACCRYQPTCSAYAIAAFSRYGLFKGFYLTVRRLMRCHPWGGHGYDPLP